MNEPTPPWRSFPSGPPAPVHGGPPAPDQDGRIPRPGHPTPSVDVARSGLPYWLVPALLVGGGLLAGVAVAVVGLGAVLASPPVPPVSDPFDVNPGLQAQVLETPPTELVVDVAGAVANPGLHRLRMGDRVGDAIEAAGGFAPRADLAASSQSLNLAQPLEDGAKVLVPELGIDRASAAAAAGDDRIDINGASSSALESLPGIGPVTAGKIIDAREDEPFGAVHELRSRGLVGEKVYEDIKNLVRAG